MKHGNRCAELAHECHVVLHDDDRDAFLVDGVDERAGGPGFLRPHAGGRLVEQKEYRPHGERHADGEPLPLTVRKLGHAAILGAGEVEPLEQPRDLRIHRLTREAVLERQLHVVAHGEVAIDAEAHRDTCAATVPIPLLVIAGTNDRSVPYDGWLFPTGRGLSVPETMEHFRLLHGCTGQKTDLLYDRDAKDGSRVLEVVWTGCAAESAVRLLRVEGGGHNRPSHEPLPDAWRERAGVHNRDIESAEEVWAFLRQFRKGDAQA